MHEKGKAKFIKVPCTHTRTDAHSVTQVHTHAPCPHSYVLIHI
jgi:hypothetical protein